MYYFDWINHNWDKKNFGKIGGKNMTIVVKKVPKPLRGLVKFIFGIKNT